MIKKSLIITIIIITLFIIILITAILLPRLYPTKFEYYLELRISDLIQLLVVCTAIISPLLIPELRKYWLRPKLEVYFQNDSPFCGLVTDSLYFKSTRHTKIKHFDKIEAEFWSINLMVKNRGLSVLHNCEAVVDNLSLNQKSTINNDKRFFHPNLRWINHENKLRIDINPEKLEVIQIGYLLVTTNINNSNQNFHFSLPDMQFDHRYQIHYDELKSGELFFRLSFYSSNSEVVTNEFHVIWNGKIVDDEKEMKNNFEIIMK